VGACVFGIAYLRWKRGTEVCLYWRLGCVVAALPTGTYLHLLHHQCLYTQCCRLLEKAACVRPAVQGAFLDSSTSALHGVRRRCLFRTALTRMLTAVFETLALQYMQRCVPLPQR
jgi:hypothetical protein